MVKQESVENKAWVVCPSCGNASIERGRLGGACYHCGATARDHAMGVENKMTMREMHSKGEQPPRDRKKGRKKTNELIKRGKTQEEDDVSAP